MKLGEILTTEEELIKSGFRIENDLIKTVNVNVIGHVGNAVTLEVVGNNQFIFAGYCNTSNLG